MLTIGFLINPYAGVGGPMALKGSDNIELEAVLAKGGQCLAPLRAMTALKGLLDYQSHIQWVCAPGIMGESVLLDSGFSPLVIGELNNDNTTASDTERLVADLVIHGVDILLFVGGDGTARNVVNGLKRANQSLQLALGIPAGVKMHSGVYTVSPQAAVGVLVPLIKQEPVSTAIQEVRDIDEEALRAGRVNSRYYGELFVPNDQRYVQQVKNTARQSEEQAQLEIAASIVDDMEDDTLYLIGCGTTPKAVMDELGLPNTLLGIDVVLGRELIATDLEAQQIEHLLSQYPYHKVVLLVTAIGGQGHIIGRGNQQITSQILHRIGKDNMVVLLTPSKLAEYENRPLLMDSGDPLLDQQWAGLITLHTGYQQTVVYPLNSALIA